MGQECGGSVVARGGVKRIFNVCFGYRYYPLDIPLIDTVQSNSFQTGTIVVKLSHRGRQESSRDRVSIRAQRYE
jgi:hypothetical protein